MRVNLQFWVKRIVFVSESIGREKKMADKQPVDGDCLPARWIVVAIIARSLMCVRPRRCYSAARGSFPPSLPPSQIGELIDCYVAGCDFFRETVARDCGRCRRQRAIDRRYLGLVGPNTATTAERYNNRLNSDCSSHPRLPSCGSLFHLTRYLSKSPRPAVLLADFV